MPCPYWLHWSVSCFIGRSGDISGCTRLRDPGSAHACGINTPLYIRTGHSSQAYTLAPCFLARHFHVGSVRFTLLHTHTHTYVCECVCGMCVYVCVVIHTHQHTPTPTVLHLSVWLLTAGCVYDTIPASDS